MEVEGESTPEMVFCVVVEPPEEDARFEIEVDRPTVWDQDGLLPNTPRTVLPDTPRTVWEESGPRLSSEEEGESNEMVVEQPAEARQGGSQADTPGSTEYLARQREAELEDDFADLAREREFELEDAEVEENLAREEEAKKRALAQEGE